jgi:hypothetical protein
LVVSYSHRSLERLCRNPVHGFPSASLGAGSPLQNSKT